MKFKNVILLFIFSGLLIICNIVLNKEVMETIISLVSVLCNFATLLIAISLFDKYNVGSKLIENNIKIVNEYVEFLKKYSFTLNHYTYSSKNKNIELYGFSIVNMDRENSNNNIFINSKMYFELESYFEFYNLLCNYTKSIWMPREIKDASEFLMLESHINIMNKNQLKGRVSILENYSHKLKKDVFMKDEDYLVKDFYNDINNLLNTIRKWINKQAPDVSIDI